MNLSTESQARKAAWLVIFAGLAVRIAISGQFLLAPDESNYWQWSRYLALGYQDHPPMIAWTIWLATKLFGQNELAVRLPANLGVTLAAGYTVLLAARMFSWRTAFNASLLFQGILLFNGAALIATPDSMLLPCWAGACYHAAQALKHNRRGQWLATGCWFGLGLLSKYTMLLFLPSLLLSIIFCKPYRGRLSQPAPWLGLLLGFALFTPVLVWNAHNEWATFRHVLFMGGINTNSFFTLRYFIDFLGEQLALLSPLVFFLILAAWLGRHPDQKPNDPDQGFLLWTSLTTFVVFFVLSFHARVYGNWPAPGYLTAIVLIAGLHKPAGGKVARAGGLWKPAVLVAYLFTLPVLGQVVTPLLPLPVKLDRTARETVGWDQLGKNVAEVMAAMPARGNPFIFGISYQFASELAFYVPGQPRTVSLNRWTRPNVYDYWFNDAMLKGRDGVGVIDDPNLIVLLRVMFDRVEIARSLPVYRDYPLLGRQLVATYHLVRAYGFKEGQRWQPRQAEDIRATKTQTGR